MPYEYLYNQEKSEELSKFSMLFARLYQIMDDIKDIKDIDNRVK
jgi:geranylgeranyl pyrophosphate synthase